MGNVFISYSHDGNESSRLAEWLHTQLSRQGYDAFIYQKDIPSGQRWSERISDLLPKSDLFILLLSEQSSRSDFIIEEVRRAHSLNCQHKRPVILTVRVGFDGDPGYHLSAMLNPYQWLVWKDNKDSRTILKQILQLAGDPNAKPESKPALKPKSAPKRAPLPAPFPMASPVPGGAIALANPFYVKRAIEKQVMELAAEPGATVTIEAPRQIGKSSLLQRYLTKCQKAQQRSVLIDLSRFDASDFQSYDLLLAAIADRMSRELGIESGRPAELAGSRKFCDWIEDRVLKTVKEPIVAAFDEADAVFDYKYCRDFFKMLRSWQNSRVASSLWRRFGLAMVISTERNLLIENATASPFNIGLHVMLEPFDLKECLRLKRAV